MLSIESKISHERYFAHELAEFMNDQLAKMFKAGFSEDEALEILKGSLGLAFQNVGPVGQNFALRMLDNG